MKKLLGILFCCTALGNCPPSPPGDVVGDFIRSARAAYAADDAYTNSIVRLFKERAGGIRQDVPGPSPVGWVNVDGTRNFRDIGGWTGLKTGLAYRGAEPNCQTNPACFRPGQKRSHGLFITPAGADTLAKRLGIKTDLDLRARGESPTPDETPVPGARLVRISCAGYMKFLSNTVCVAQLLRVFADRSNYPIYFHCWGGADRTGSLAFLLEGLCGVSETDLSIDYELTTFGGAFGSRVRVDSKPFLFASMVKEMKKRPGATLRDKIAHYVIHECGLTPEEVASIRGILERDSANDYPVRPVEMTEVSFTGGFWRPRLETNRMVTVKTDFEKCELARIPNFEAAARREWGTFKGIPFDDSDVYKVIEGAAYTLATHPDPALEDYLDRLIAQIAKAQEPDGYLYTARTLHFNYGVKNGKMQYGRMGPTRWSDCGASHELYNVGHMYEAAVAYLQATGKRTLLDVAIRSADLVDRTFGFGPTQIKEAPGHEEIELALCKLYRVTGERRYLALAKTFLDMRGRKDLRATWNASLQDHLPVVEQREAIGHAVRAGYLYCGMADVAALAGDRSYLTAIDAIWENVVGRKLHLNGGIGAHRRVSYADKRLGSAGEAFGDDYDLPNEDAYLETCAAIANALWNERMFLMHADAKYIDVLERALYNGMLSGVSLGGDEFFYPNPLASKGGYKRSKWFGCSCCPVNVVRFLPQVPKFAYAVCGDAAYVNLFAESAATLRLGCGRVKISQKTDYPWNGSVRLDVTPPKDGTRFALHVRVPGWCVGRPVPSDLYVQTVPGTLADFSLKVNGMDVEVKPVKGFCVVDRSWKNGDTVEISMNMPVRRIKAHVKVEADRDRLAVERGPIVFCAEGVDNGGKAFDTAIPADVTFTEGRIELDGQPFVSLKASSGTTLVPYCIWDNREPGNEMQTWFR